MQRDSYPMPDIQETLDQLAGATWVTSLDLGSAFWQLPLAEESRDCTGFILTVVGFSGNPSKCRFAQKEVPSWTITLRTAK